MYVAGRHHRLVKAFSQFHDPAVQILQILFILNPCNLIACDHKPVIPKRLDLQIVIEIHDLRDPLLRLLIQDRLVQLPRLAGASDDQPLPVLRQLTLGNPWTAGIIFQVGFGDQRIEIHPSHLIFR